MGAYEFYFQKVLLPVAPESLEIKVNNKNSTLTLSDGNEINILKLPGLSEINFTVRLPVAKYPWAFYGGAADQVRYLNLFEELKTKRSVFDFIVLRNKSDYSTHKTAVFSTSIRVSLEDYTITEDSEQGGDVLVEINLKQFRNYYVTLGYNSTKRLLQNNVSGVNATVKIMTQKGDTLDRIVTKYYEVNDQTRTRALNAVYQTNKILSSYGISMARGTIFGTLSPLPAGITLILPAVL